MNNGHLIDCERHGVVHLILIFTYAVLIFD